MATAAEIHAVLLQRIKVLGDGIEPILQGLTEELAREIRLQAGLIDHTLKDLAKLGHPYKRYVVVKPDSQRKGKRGRMARRLGTPAAVRAKREASLGHDLQRVHVQSRLLFDSVYQYVRRTQNSIVGAAGIDPIQVPYLRYVVQGTRYMIPRPFIDRAARIARPRLYAQIRMGMNALARSMNLT